MNAFEELKQPMTSDQAQSLSDLNPSEMEPSSSTQRLLDEMLGLFEDDDSTMLITYLIKPDLYTDSDD